MHTAIIKFDTLPYPVGASAEHHYFLLVSRIGFTFLFISRIQICRSGIKFGRTGIDPFEYRMNQIFVPVTPDLLLIEFHQFCNTAIRKPFRFPASHDDGGKTGQF